METLDKQIQNAKHEMEKTLIEAISNAKVDFQSSCGIDKSRVFLEVDTVYSENEAGDVQSRMEILVSVRI